MIDILELSGNIIEAGVETDIYSFYSLELIPLKNGKCIAINVNRWDFEIILN